MIHRFLLMTILTIYMKKTSECINTHVPNKKVTEKYLKLRSKPLINVRIQKLMSYRDKLFNELNKHLTPFNKYFIINLGIEWFLNREEIKKSYFQEYFEKHKTNMKILWHGIRSIVNTSNKSQASYFSQLNENRKLISDPVKMANIFNKYFVNVSHNIDKSIPRAKKSALDYLKKQNLNSLFLAPVTPKEIETFCVLTKTNLLDHTVFQFFCFKFLVHIFQNL